MADDPNPQLRAELVAALAVLAPQIRGLHDLMAVSISSDLGNEIQAQIVARERRRDLIAVVIQWLDGALHALNALQADGYPVLAPIQTPPALLSELTAQQSDLDAALGLFAPEQAATISVALGAPVERTPAP